MPQIPTYTPKEAPPAVGGAVRSNLHIGATDLSSDMAALGKLGKTVETSIADDIFATQGKVMQDREDKNNSLILYGKMAQEKTQAIADWKTRFEGSDQQDHEGAMNLLQNDLNDIGQKYMDQAANDRVRAILQNYHNETNVHYTTHGADYLATELLKTTAATLDNTADMITREAITTGDYASGLGKLETHFNDAKAYLGERSTNELLKKYTERMTETFIRQRIANPDTSAMMVQAWSNNKKYWMDRIDPNKSDEIERLMQTAGKQAKIDTVFTDLVNTLGNDYSKIQAKLMDPGYLKQSGISVTDAAHLGNIFKTKENYELNDEALKRGIRVQEQVDTAFKNANSGKIATAIRQINNSPDIPEDKKFQYVQMLQNAVKKDESPAIKAAREMAKIQISHFIRTGDIGSEDEILKLSSKIGLTHSDYNGLTKELDEANAVKGQHNFYQDAEGLIDAKIGFDKNKDKGDWDKVAKRNQYLGSLDYYMKAGKLKANDPAVMDLAKKLTEGTETRYIPNPFGFDWSWKSGKSILEMNEENMGFINPEAIGMPKRTRK